MSIYTVIAALIVGIPAFCAACVYLAEPGKERRLVAFVIAALFVTLTLRLALSGEGVNGAGVAMRGSATLVLDMAAALSFLALALFQLLAALSRFGR